MTYWLTVDGHKILSAPKTMKEITERFGSIISLESSGHKLVPVEDS